MRREGDRRGNLASVPPPHGAARDAGGQPSHRTE